MFEEEDESRRGFNPREIRSLLDSSIDMTISPSLFVFVGISDASAEEDDIFFFVFLSSSVWTGDGEDWSCTKRLKGEWIYEKEGGQR